MNAVHESDNYETGNCFLKIGKNFTIITMFDLKAGFLKQLVRFIIPLIPTPVVPIKSVVPIGGALYYSDKSQNVIPIVLILFR